MEHDYYFKIGRTLRIFRKGYGFTQNDVAQKADLALSTYSNYENNNRKPHRDALLKICELYNIDPPDFFTICYMVQDDSLKRNSDDTVLFNKLFKILKLKREGLLDIYPALLDDIIIEKSSDTSNIQENKLLMNFRQLNQAGKKEAIKRVEELAEIPRYTEIEKQKPSLSQQMKNANLNRAATTKKSNHAQER